MLYCETMCSLWLQTLQRVRLNEIVSLLSSEQIPVVLCVNFMTQCADVMKGFQDKQISVNMLLFCLCLRSRLNFEFVNSLHSNKLTVS